MTTKPWANPAGTQNCRLFCADSVTPCHWPKVGEPWRMSTATSKTSPCRTWTSLPWASGLLVVETAQDAARGEREVVLDEGRETRFGVALGLPGFHEEAAIVAEDFRFEHQDAGQRRVDDVHSDSLSLQDAAQVGAVAVAERFGESLEVSVSM